MSGNLFERLRLTLFRAEAGKQAPPSRYFLRDAFPPYYWEQLDIVSEFVCCRSVGRKSGRIANRTADCAWRAKNETTILFNRGIGGTRQAGKSYQFPAIFIRDITRKTGEQWQALKKTDRAIVSDSSTTTKSEKQFASVALTSRTPEQSPTTFSNL